MKFKRVPNSPYFYLGAFVIVVLILIGISAFYKGLLLVENSVYKNKLFIFLVASPQKKYLVGIKETERKIYLLTIENGFYEKNILGKNTLYYGFPIDGVVETKTVLPDESIESLSTIMKIVTDSKNNSFRNMNQFDLFKVYLIYTYSGFTIEKETFVPKQIEENKIEYIQIRDDLAKDSDIINEKVPIEVVNISGINGAGGRIADLLERVGYNVVSVQSPHGIEENAKIIRRVGQNSYSIRRLEKIFSLNSLHKDEIYLADVTIVVNKEFATKYFDL